MKKIPFLSLLICLFTISINAQTLTESLVLAEESNKNVLMVFSGSDWCKPCMQLKESILENEEFASFKEENLVILIVDFPYKRKNRLPKEQQEHNNQLAERYNEEGYFPKTILLSSDEKILGEIFYEKSMLPVHFREQIEAITTNPIAND